MPDPFSPTPYVEPVDVRGRVDALRDTEDFPDSMLADLISEFEEIAESYRGVAYTPRERTETQELYSIRSDMVEFRRDRHRVFLKWPEVREVSSLSVELYGVTTVVDLATLRIDGHAGSVDLGADFEGTATFVYKHGLDAPSSMLKRCCRVYVRAAVLADQTGLPRDVIVSTFEGMTNRFSTPDWDKGRPTGYLDVDRLLNTLKDYRGVTLG